MTSQPGNDRDRFLALREAIRHIQDGSTVGIGGYFQHRHPMALIRELIRQQKRHLHIVTPLGGIDCDILLATGVATKVTFGFVSMDIFGQAPSFRRTVENGIVQAVEFGDLALMRAFEAAERGLRWLPTRAWNGSDIAPHHPGEALDIGTGEWLWKVPALQLDWALVHVPYATSVGDLVLLGEGYDAVMVKSASRVIATTERVIPKRHIVEHWNGRTVARYRCDFVIEMPFGGHPTSCYPIYVQDALHILEYMGAAESDINHYIERYVAPGEETYLTTIGVERLLSLCQRMALARRLGEIYR